MNKSGAGETAQAGLLKIGELARQADISVTTVKYYVKEGLVQPACKTGPNMSYYDPACVERIRYIKSLQKERYYPLSVIRGLLEREGSYSREADLLDAIHKVDYRSSTETYSGAEALRLSGLTRSQSALLSQSGVITGGHRRAYTAEDVRIMQLARRRLDAGMPLEHTVRAFSAYNDALKQAVEGDVDSLIQASFLGDTSTEDAIRLIQTSDETLDVYVGLRRAALNREYGSRRLALLDSFSETLLAGLRRFSGALAELGFQTEALCLRRGVAPGASDPLGQALYHFRLLPDSAGGEIMHRVMLCGAARTWFSAERETPPDAGGLAADGLRLCWLSLAPPVLGCGDAAAAAETRLVRRAGTLPPATAAALPRLVSLLTAGGE